MRKNVPESALLVAVANLREGVQVIGFDWTYRYLNETAAKHARRPASELIGRSMSECFPGIEGTDMFVALQRVMRNRRSERMLNHFSYESGGSAWFELLIEPVPEGLCVLSLDVTDQRATELQLRQAHKLETLGRLTAGIAHDFNNLLTAIVGYSELALQQPMPDSLAEDIREVHKAGQRASRLTRQLLAFSRGQPLKIEVVDLHALLHDLRRLLERLLMSVRLEVHTDPAVASVLADPCHVEQAVMNLVINARDAMPRGGRVRISTSPSPPPKAGRDETVRGVPRYIALTVEDTGVGMSQEVLEHALDPFFTTKPYGQGTGLGLATVNDTVRRCGGYLTLDSTPGVGTKVTIFLQAAADEGSSPTASSPVRPSRALASETILVVEPEDMVRQFVTKVLRDSGYNVIEATSTGEGLTLAERHSARIDALVMDPSTVALGDDRTRALVGRHPDLKVLHAVGSGGGARLYARDFVGRHRRLLPKPFTAAALITELRALFAE